MSTNKVIGAVAIAAGSIFAAGVGVGYVAGHQASPKVALWQGQAEDDVLVTYLDCETGVVTLGPLWAVEGCDEKL